MQSDSFKLKRKFIVRLGKMLHQYGTPAYRLETHLMAVANSLDLRSSFICSPTAMTFVLWTEGHEEEYTHAARVQPGDLDLGSLSRVDEVVEKVASGEFTLAEGDARLDEIETMENPYGETATGLSFLLAGGAFAMLMRSNWSDVVWSAILGLLVYFIVRWSQRSKGVTNMLEPLVAMSTAFCATAVAAYVDPSIHIRLVVLSSIIVFIPGLALTIGLAELSQRHLVSGTAKTMDAVMMLFKLFFGAFLGMELGFGIFGEVEQVKTEVLPEFVTWIAVVLLSSSLIIAFRVRSQHIVWSLVVAVFAFAVASATSSYFGYAVGAFLGAFAVGLYGNLFTRLAKSPAVIVTMQGLIVLVPGSKTFISLNTLVTGKGFESVQSPGLHAFMIFISLVAGLIFANSFLPPKKSL